MNNAKFNKLHCHKMLPISKVNNRNFNRQRRLQSPYCIKSMNPRDFYYWLLLLLRCLNNSNTRFDTNVWSQAWLGGNHNCLLLPFLVLNICFILEVFLSSVWTPFLLLSSSRENWALSEEWPDLLPPSAPAGDFLIREWKGEDFSLLRGAGRDCKYDGESWVLCRN